MILYTHLFQYKLQVNVRVMVCFSSIYDVYIFNYNFSLQYYRWIHIFSWLVFHIFWKVHLFGVWFLEVISITCIDGVIFETIWDGPPTWGNIQSCWFGHGVELLNLSLQFKCTEITFPILSNNILLASLTFVYFIYSTACQIPWEWCYHGFLQTKFFLWVHI